MCQLTLTNLASSRKNAAVTLFSALINSKHNAPHGFGFFNGELVWKTADRASSLADLGDIISSYITTDAPIISHVRLASKGIELKVENNHPFETSDFIGAHNGTLYLKSEEPYSYSATGADNNASRGSDSERFFNMLQIEYTKNGGKFVPAIQSVMAEHKGKFAFLIYEKPTQTYYVIRGKTADLHVVEVYLEKKKSKQYLGCIVNTEKSDLQDLADVITNVWGLLGESGFFTFGKVEELKQETIYAVKGLKLKEVAELKENPLYTPQPNRAANHSWIGSTNSTTKKHKRKNASNSAITIETLIRSIVEFQNMHFLHPSDMDLIFYKTLGVVVNEADEETLEFFAKSVMPKLHINKDGRKIFRMAGIRAVPYYFYMPEKDGGFGLEFPWMVNKPEKLQIAIKKYDDKLKSMRSKLEQEVSIQTGIPVSTVGLQTTVPISAMAKREGD